jgi:hypothetical protein
MHFLANHFLFDPLYKFIIYLVVIAVIPFIFILRFTFGAKNKNAKFFDARKAKINNALRILYFWICILSIPYAFICWLGGIVAKNILLYNLNLILIGLYFPITLATLFYSRKLESQKKSAAALAILLIPFICMIISVMLLFTM